MIRGSSVCENKKHIGEENCKSPQLLLVAARKEKKIRHIYVGEVMLTIEGRLKKFQLRLSS